MLLPCYRDMDAYDLPEELSVFRCQDMGKVGFEQDLIRGIKKTLSSSDPGPSAQTAPASAPSVASLLKRAELFWGDHDWTSAMEKSYKELQAETDSVASRVKDTVQRLNVDSTALRVKTDQARRRLEAAKKMLDVWMGEGSSPEMPQRHICSVCGYVLEDGTLPSACPNCKAPQSKFITK